MERPKEKLGNGIGRRAVLLAASAATASGPLTAAAAQAATPGQVIRIGYIRSTVRHPTISLLDAQAPNDGLAGAMVGAGDDNTTGRFLGQKYELSDAPVSESDDVVVALHKLAAGDIRLVLTDVPADGVLKLAAAAGPLGVTIFNIQAPDDALRQQDCRADLFHIAPSRAMLADALGEYLVLRRWSRWLLVYGSHKSDALLADAYRRSARRYGARIVQERIFKDTGGARQTDSGIIETQQKIPVFTQNAPEYDVLVAADENQVFASYLPYRTWDPRPVAGSAGLRPCSWDPSSEYWGGRQMQDRFKAAFHRLMTPLDMQAWTAVRMIGEAASRTHSADAEKIIAFMKRPDFTVAAYKGDPLSLRNWDWQLRQPILLSDGRTVVSVSPQPGFLHQVNDLDTLGIDRPETKCKLS